MHAGVDVRHLRIEGRIRYADSAGIGFGKSRTRFMTMLRYRFDYQRQRGKKQTCEGCNTWRSKDLDMLLHATSGVAPWSFVRGPFCAWQSLRTRYAFQIQPPGGTAAQPVSAIVSTGVSLLNGWSRASPGPRERLGRTCRSAAN